MVIPLILQALASRYRASKQGRTGAAANDYTIDYRHLLEAAHATDGEARVEAEKVLREAAAVSGGKLTLDHQARDASLILRVRLAREGGEEWLFQQVGAETPAQSRERMSALFIAAAAEVVPAIWQSRWQSWCLRMREQALAGQTVAPFSPDDREGAGELLQTLRGVLNWPGESLIRFVSCVLTGDSKRLETLRSKVLEALHQISEDEVSSLAEVGLLDAPRLVLVHGPLALESTRGCVDLSLLEGPVRISERDLTHALSVTTTALRCLSIENETTFHELAKLRSNTLLVQTSHPGRGVQALYQRLPADLPCWHFGDTDPAGFDILRELRFKTQRSIQPLHMNFRDLEDSPPLTETEQKSLRRLILEPLLHDVKVPLTAMLAAGRKGRFEQESLGWPQSEWPFYEEEALC